MNRQQLWEQFAGFSRFILLSIGFCNNLLDRFPPFTDRAPIQLWNCFQERPIGRNILSGICCDGAVADRFDPDSKG